MPEPTGMHLSRELPVAQWVKKPACQYRRRRSLGFDPWVRKIPWRRKWQNTPVVLPGESHAQRGLAGYSPDGKESDMTEVSKYAHTRAMVGRI